MINQLNKYGFIGSIRLVFHVLYSKFFISRNIRILRLPFYIRGREYIKWGENFTSGVNLRIDIFPKNRNNDKYLLEIGDNVEINDYVHIGVIEKIKIGNNVLIASKVFISDHNHGNYSLENHSSPLIPPSKRILTSSPIIIEENVWIGENVSILPGVKIEKGAIIGSNSVVSKNIPANCIAVGIPAKPIKKFNFKSEQWEKI